ncbi:AAA family ATPase [Dactylosporangium sp. CA-052675]|uniref:AAA family ATPase n=1 Tax=Dactylosporangium sp. CA-052675 TaxID=3239927 RepID=UPI003D921119
MARADLLLRLVQAALAGDVERVRSTVEALAAEERNKRHTVLADELAQLLSVRAPAAHHFKAADRTANQGIVEQYPKRRLHDLSLPDVVRDELAMLVEEQHRSDLLRSFNIEPRHRVLLVGPPGNGKTSCAEALAAELAVPLFAIRYENIITSFLGETSANLGRALEEVRRQHCVLFLDEFDALAKERGDEHDTGEIKRIVSALLLQLDRLPTHVVVCAATNHSELLDRAVWRRFQLRLTLPAPTRDERLTFAHRTQDRIGIPTPRSLKSVIDKLGPTSYSELDEFLLELRRRQILAGDYEGTDNVLLEGLLRGWAARANPSERREPGE